MCSQYKAQAKVSLPRVKDQGTRLDCKLLASPDLLSSRCSSLRDRYVHCAYRRRGVVSLWAAGAYPLLARIKRTRDVLVHVCGCSTLVVARVATESGSGR